MNVRTNLRAFVKAVMVGTLAGAIVPTILTALVGLSILGESGDWLTNAARAAYVIALPSIIAFCLVLPCAILIGLPATYLLVHMRFERPGAYAVIGGLAGGLVPTLLIWGSEGGFSVLILLLGAFSGAQTGMVWGRERLRAD